MASYYWLDWDTRRGLHSHAVVGGKDQDGTQIYVGRAQHSGDWMPAKVIPQKKIAYVSFNGKEVPVHTYQILCEQRFDWAPAKGGNVPPNAVVGGKTSNGETLYVGRANHKGAQTVGKVHPSHKCLYIPFDGKEVSLPDYEVLILR